MQGPFSKNMNKAMIEQYDIKYLVTKQAGDTGGEREKIEAADEMGIDVDFLLVLRLSILIVIVYR